MRVLVWAFTALLAMPATADIIDDIVNAEMNRQYIPGLALAVVKDGQIVKERGYGSANLEHDIPVSPVTMFQSGSIGKQFTAALVLLLEREGKLNLDASVRQYLDAPESWQPITLRHLLNHTSGLPDNDPAIDLKRDHSEDELLRSAFRVVPDDAPGAKWRYSNLGYQLLGFICSRVGGRFYGDQLHDRVFAPLDMESRIISERDIVRHRAAGYVRVDGRLYNQDWVAPSLNTTADGSLYVSVRDLARWSIALETDLPLNEPVRTAMRTPARLNDGSLVDYGFGWELGEAAGHRSMSHGGSWQGFNSFIVRYPEDRLAVIVLANRAGARLPVIADRVVALYLPDVVPPPRAALTANLLRSVDLVLSGSIGDAPLEKPMRRVAPGVYELQMDIDPLMVAFKVVSKDGRSISLGAPFDEHATRLAEPRTLVQDGEYLLIQLDHRTTYVFRVDARDPETISLVVREVTR